MKTDPTSLQNWPPPHRDTAGMLVLGRNSTTGSPEVIPINRPLVLQVAVVTLKIQI